MDRTEILLLLFEMMLMYHFAHSNKYNKSSVLGWWMIHVNRTPHPEMSMMCRILLVCVFSLQRNLWLYLCLLMSSQYRCYPSPGVRVRAKALSPSSEQPVRRTENSRRAKNNTKIHRLSRQVIDPVAVRPWRMCQSPASRPGRA